MTEEQKNQPLEQDMTSDTVPDTDTAAETSDTGPDTKDSEKSARETKKGGKWKKAKTYTLTQEQMDAAEAAARELESVRGELETMKDRFLRLSAEYDNFRKRTARERDSLYLNAKADTIKEFLTVYDSLERAAAAPGDADDPHKKGLLMIFKQYRDILTKLGIEEIEAQGQPFDPERHYAVSKTEDETLGENIITQVFQAGFTLDGKVIRTATVQVAN